MPGNKSVENKLFYLKSITLTVMAKDEKKNDIELKYGLRAFGLTFLFLIFWAQ